MPNVINFPKSGTRVALYTEDNMFIGTSSNSEDFIGRPGLWLTDAVIAPIKAQIYPADLLHLDSVCVLWDKVIAVSHAPSFEWLPE